MVGAWTGEGSKIVTQVTCRGAPKQMFLVMDCSISKDGVETSAHQRIGWDPQAKQIRSWTFDSAGGFGEARGFDGCVAGVLASVTCAHVGLEDANLVSNHPHGSAQKEALYMRDRVMPAMEDVREVADRLEKLVADDLWPLPKYSEMLFIK